MPPFAVGLLFLRPVVPPFLPPVLDLPPPFRPFRPAVFAWDCGGLPPAVLALAWLRLLRFDITSEYTIRDSDFRRSQSVKSKKVHFLICHSRTSASRTSPSLLQSLAAVCGHGQCLGSLRGRQPIHR